MFYGFLAICFYIVALNSVRNYVNCYPDKNEEKAKENN